MATSDIQQLTVELGQLTRVMREMVNASSRTVAAQQANIISQMDVNDQLDLYTDDLVKGQNLTKKQNKLLEEAQKLKKKEIQAAQALERAQRELTRVQQDTTASEKAKQAANANAVKAEREHRAAAAKSTEATAALTNSFGGLLKGLNLGSAAMVWFGSTLKNATLHARDQIVANQGLVEGTGSLLDALTTQQTQALKLGMSGAEYAKIISANRQVVNAMGGTAKTIEALDSSMNSFYAMTGSNAAALEALTETMTSFARTGVKPTEAVLKAYTQDVKNLAAQTGMTQAQIRNLYDDIAHDAESIDILRSARKEEREAILANQRAYVQQSIAMGMTAEQAKEAAKMLNKMVAAKPLDRLKQAAKIRALGGAMGIAGSEQAAQAVTAGKRATPEQKAALQAFSNSAANMMDQAAQQGLGMEIFATTLLDKLDLEQYYGKNSTFSTTLGDTLAKPLEDVKAAFVDASKDPLLDAGRKLDTLIGAAQQVISGTHYIGVAVSAVAASAAAIAAMMAGGKIASMAGGALEKGKSILKIGGATGGTAGTPAGTAGKVGNVLGKIGSIAGKASMIGTALDVGLGANDLVQGRAQETMSGMDYLSPMRYGMFFGDKINKLVEGVTGDSIGGKLYDWMNPQSTNLAAPTSPSAKKTDATSATTKATETGTAIKTATVSTAEGVVAQGKKIDTSNDLLQRIAELTDKQLTISEKQLMALTMTEKEKTSSETRTALRRDTRFGAQYNYV